RGRPLYFGEIVGNRGRPLYFIFVRLIGFEQLAQWVSELTAIPLPAMAEPGKQRPSVRARSILCFLAVNGLGMPMTVLAYRLGISLRPLVWRYKEAVKSWTVKS